MPVTSKTPTPTRRVEALEQRLERLEAALDAVVTAVGHLIRTDSPGPKPAVAPQPAPQPPLGDPPPEPVFGLLSNAEGFRHAGDGRDPFP